MARISGIDLPKNKRGEIGLTYIYGIGRSTAQHILTECGIDFSRCCIGYFTTNRKSLIDETLRWIDEVWKDAWT